VEEGLGAGFWFKVIGAIIACGIGAMLLFLLINGAWYRWGGLGTLVIFFGIILTWAYFHDRKQVKAYSDQA
jgi:hypothetical protein